MTPWSIGESAVTSNLSILIVGAGPTGLVLALSLARRGVKFRIIDEKDAPGRESRALAVHARTLEFYRQFGFGDAVVAAGTEIRSVNLVEGGERVGGFSIADLGAGLSPYPFVIDFPQDEHERFLVERLRDLGVEVERGVRLDRYLQKEGAVEAVLVHGGTEEKVRCDWLCGCDGARSRVREGLGVGFAGGTYQHLYYVADVKLSAGQNDQLYLALGADAFALRMPARKGAMCRLIGFAPDRPEGSPPVTFADVQPIAERLLQAKVQELNWFSTYKVHHRVASHFHVGRCFLAGDAGHLHSPTGGQGMNTGIGDAINLGWKLADVVRGRAAPALLDSYEPERIAFARRLVGTTDRAFKAIVGDGWAGSFVRSVLMPHVVPTVTSFAAGRRLFFRTLSQIMIAYPDSALSEGRAGAINGGDRLPWVHDTDNFAPLASLDWQLHVYGKAPVDLAQLAAGLSLPLFSFGWSDAVSNAGLSRDAAYLIRPDGHVGLAMRVPDPAVLRRYVDKQRLRFGA